MFCVFSLGRRLLTFKKKKVEQLQMEICSLNIVQGYFCHKIMCICKKFNSKGCSTIRMHIRGTWVRSDLCHSRAFSRKNQHQSKSISTNQNQSATNSINQNQSESISINQHQSSAISIKQHQSAPISIIQNQSVSIKINWHNSS